MSSLAVGSRAWARFGIAAGVLANAMIGLAITWLVVVNALGLWDGLALVPFAGMVGLVISTKVVLGDFEYWTPAFADQYVEPAGWSIKSVTLLRRAGSGYTLLMSAFYLMRYAFPAWMGH